MEEERDSGNKHGVALSVSTSSSSPSGNGEKLKPGAMATAPEPGRPPPPNPFNEQGKRFSAKEEIFRQQFVMPAYLRVAMATSVESQIVDYGHHAPSQTATAPSYPLIVMINSRSGGRQGVALRSTLNNLLSKEQVFDLSTTPPKEFFRYGLRCLEKLADNGDQCAKDTRNRLRVIVAGGDGTVGWVLGSISELHVEHRLPIPPIGIIPLGTGNDLSRSFGWGGTFMFSCSPFVRRCLQRAASSETAELDSWMVMVRTCSSENIQLPHSLQPQQHVPMFAEDNFDDVKAASFEGVFYNYFSIGMDAQVAYGFHNLREKQPYLARGPVSNKMVYSSCSCVQGWFCTPCSSNPRVRALRNIMQLYIRKEPNGDWELFDLPHNVRAIIMLNLQSYASGRNPWGHPTNEYNQKKRFTKPNSQDGRLEIFGLFDGWHASLVMLSLRSAKRLVQACAVRMQLIADERHRSYMQMDGEPWRQPLSKIENPTIVEITPSPTRSLMLKAA